MDKYHTNHKGVVGVCRAGKFSSNSNACPFGGEHFDTIEEAYKAYEKRNNAITFDTATMRKSSRDEATVAPDATGVTIKANSADWYLESYSDNYMTKAQERAGLASEYFSRMRNETPQETTFDSFTIPSSDDLKKGLRNALKRVMGPNTIASSQVSPAPQEQQAQTRDALAARRNARGANNSALRNSLKKMNGL